MGRSSVTWWPENRRCRGVGHGYHLKPGMYVGLNEQDFGASAQMVKRARTKRSTCSQTSWSCGCFMDLYSVFPLPLRRRGFRKPRDRSLEIINTRYQVSELSTIRHCSDAVHPVLVGESQQGLQTSLWQIRTMAHISS